MRKQENHIWSLLLSKISADWVSQAVNRQQTCYLILWWASEFYATISNLSQHDSENESQYLVSLALASDSHQLPDGTQVQHGSRRKSWVTTTIKVRFGVRLLVSQCGKESFFFFFVTPQISCYMHRSLCLPVHLKGNTPSADWAAASLGCVQH